MATPAEIVALIDTAIATYTGESSITINGRTITYRSLAELWRVRSQYNQEIRSSSGANAFQVQHIKAGGPY